jgi:nicotinamidase-related amidase
VQGTPGCELIPELKYDRIMLTIDKGQDRRVESYSAFGPPFRSPRVGTSDLHNVLKEAGITHVFTVGLAYDYCVRSTAIDAAEHGFKTFVIEDASSPVARKPVDKARTRQEYQDGGVVVIRSDSAELNFVR